MFNSLGTIETKAIKLLFISNRMLFIRKSFTIPLNYIFVLFLAITYIAETAISIIPAIAIISAIITILLNFKIENT